MKIRVFSIVRSSEEDFYQECIDSHREWCENNAYDYFLHVNPRNENARDEWRDFKILVAECVQAQEDDILIFLKNSVMIMETQTEFPILKEIQVPGIWTTYHNMNFECDVVVVRVNDAVKKALTFVSNFADVPSSYPPFAMGMISLLFPGILNQVNKRTICSNWFTQKINTVEIKAVTEKSSSPGIYANASVLQNKYSQDSLYTVGDFSVDLGSDKYMAKILAKDFSIFRAEYERIKKESKQIITEFQS